MSTAAPGIVIPVSERGIFLGSAALSWREPELRIGFDLRRGGIPKEKAAPIGAGAAFSLGMSLLLFGVRLVGRMKGN